MASETESDYESTDSDFNFGDMTISDNEADQKDEANDTINSDSKCNLNVIEPLWFLANDAIYDDAPNRFHRKNKILKAKQCKCELFYAQQKYENALAEIQDIFMQFDIGHNDRYGNQLLDILIRCLCKCNRFDIAMKHIAKLLVRDVSFGSLRLITSIYTKTEQYEKSFNYSLDLTKKEAANPMAWYQLSLCSKNIENYEFCFVCLRLLASNIKHFSAIHRYSNSKCYHQKLLNFARNEKKSIKKYLHNFETLQKYQLQKISEIFIHNHQLFDFLQHVLKRFRFRLSSVSDHQ